LPREGKVLKPSPGARFGPPEASTLQNHLQPALDDGWPAEGPSSMEMIRLWSLPQRNGFKRVVYDYVARYALER
jgi:hypothetical protein